MLTYSGNFPISLPSTVLDTDFLTNVKSIRFKNCDIVFHYPSPFKD